MEARQLARVERGHFEEARAGAVHHRREDPPELVLQRGELAHERRRVDPQPGPVHDRERDRFEEADPAAREDCDSLGRREVGGNADEFEDPVDVLPDRLLDVPVEPEAREALEHDLHPVLELDEVLAPRAVPRLELEVAAHHPMAPGADAGEARERLTQRRIRGARPVAAGAGRGASRPARRRPVHDNSRISAPACAGSRRVCNRRGRNRASPA